MRFSGLTHCTFRGFAFSLFAGQPFGLLTGLGFGGSAGGLGLCSLAGSFRFGSLTRGVFRGFAFGLFAGQPFGLLTGLGFGGDTGGLGLSGLARCLSGFALGAFTGLAFGLLLRAGLLGGAGGFVFGLLAGQAGGLGFGDAAGDFVGFTLGVGVLERFIGQPAGCCRGFQRRLVGGLRFVALGREALGACDVFGLLQRHALGLAVFGGVERTLLAPTAQPQQQQDNHRQRGGQDPGQQLIHIGGPLGQLWLHLRGQAWQLSEGRMA
ncbi:hypothetical protein ACG04R_02295 [Roseateles sp. BYS78W]|uniref:Uncharacterized protein n=1 Tax=Pelomonas candidula TaxID=3299025 RepID=A0ABW7H6G8_9BURK